MNVVNGVLCWKDSPLARLDVVTPADLVETRWVIYKRDVLMYQRLATYFLQFQLPAPRVVMEVDTLAATMRMVRGSHLLTATPTTLGDVAAEFDLVLLPLEKPIWSFPSGAWMRRSTQGYPILKRSLEILRALVPQSPGHSSKLSHHPD